MLHTSSHSDQVEVEGAIKATALQRAREETRASYIEVRLETGMITPMSGHDFERVYQSLNLRMRRGSRLLPGRGPLRSSYIMRQRNGAIHAISVFDSHAVFRRARLAGAPKGRTICCDAGPSSSSAVVGSSALKASIRALVKDERTAGDLFAGKDFAQNDVVRPPGASRQRGNRAGPRLPVAAAGRRR
jgi:hypothetical protein